MTGRAVLAVVVLLSASAAYAQNAPSNGWLDVNFVGLTPGQESQTYTVRTTVTGETATAATAYPDFPTAKGGEVGGGVRLGALPLGLGLRFNQVKYEYTVGLAVNIPHPLFFNRFGQDADTTDDTLERQDNNLDIQIAYIAPTPDAVSLRIFGGPSYFKVRQEMVGILRYSQSFNLLGANVVDIASYEQEEVEGTAWGFNVGTDVGFFFSRHVGVGGTVRFSRATVEIDEPLTDDSAELKAGGTMFGGGLRIRF